MKHLPILLTAIVLTMLFACVKEGPGGKCVIKGSVKHHDSLIPGATVYIKYNATESPGDDITKYDASVNANSAAYYEFADLRKGDYYLFAVGFDSSINQPVYGGIPVKLKTKTEVLEVDIPVVE